MMQWSLPQICVRRDASHERGGVQTLPGSVIEACSGTTEQQYYEAAKL